MFNYNKNKKPRKLHAELPPGVRIQKLFEEYIEPFLAKYDFRYVKSEFTFKRKVGDFSQEIWISKSKYNRGDEVCGFWINISVRVLNYIKWHNLRYGKSPRTDIVMNFYHHNLKEWKTKFGHYRYNLAKQDNIQVFEEIPDNLFKIAFPLLDEYSNYENAADLLLQRRQFFSLSKIIDFYIMENKMEKARNAVIFIDSCFKNDKDSSPQLISELKDRKNILSPLSDS
ncbi:MAG TPA: hypothetical protein VK711_12750 [Puia sp.]|nr:hypothetical protein [Puia sp.]